MDYYDQYYLIDNYYAFVDQFDPMTLYQESSRLIRLMLSKVIGLIVFRYVNYLKLANYCMVSIYYYRRLLDIPKKKGDITEDAEEEESDI